MRKTVSSILTTILLLGMFVFGALTAEAQTYKVSGVVIDDLKQPVMGATIIQEGTTTGTTTDTKGEFTISLNKSDANIVVAFLGMVTQTVPVANKVRLTITMQTESLAMDDVVVTALGIRRETKALGYAVSKVDAEDLSAGREQNAMQAMIGKVAGVDISTTSAGPTGSTRVLIRGNSQLSGSNQPLYVLDGLVLDNSQFSTGDENKYGGSGLDYGDVMSSINPEDIESISVLKGPSASALYGSMAANGVIMITTKQGSKKQPLGIEVSSNVSMVTLLSNFDDYQRVFGQGRNGAPPLTQADAQQTTQSAWGGKLDPNLSFQIYDGRWMPYRNANDNILSFFDTGVTLQNTVTLSSGNEKASMRVSVSDTRNWDIVPGSTFDRTNITFRGSTKLNKKMEIDASATYTTESVVNRPSLSDVASNIGNSLVGIAPNFDQRWLKESYKDSEDRYVQWNASDYRLNPYWVINEMENSSVRNRLMGQARFSWNLYEGLKFSFRGGLDTYTLRATVYNPINTPRYLTGNIVERSSNVVQVNFEGMLTYNRRFKKFDVNAFVGASLLKYRNEVFYNEGSTQVLPGVRSMNAFAVQSVSQELPRKEVRSVFGQVSVGYDGWAYLDATVRNDVTSTLAPENRSYLYPSVSGSVIFSNLFKHGDWLTFGKLRASWANVGSDTGPYKLYMTYDTKDFKLNGQALGQANPTGGTIPNLQIKPTSTDSFEMGLEMKFFKNRLGFDLTLYQTSTKDQIMELPISPSSGYGRALINAGEIRNRGIELTLQATPVQGAFTWNSSFTYSRNQNKVESLHPAVNTYRLAEARWAGAEIHALVGEAYGVITGRAMQRNPEGRVVVNDNGLPLFESTVSVLGNGTHDHVMGLSNQFSYKGINLSVLFDAKLGADIYSMSMMQSHNNGTSINTLPGREEWYASEQARALAGSPANWVATGGFKVDGVKAGPVVDGVQTWVENEIYVNPQTFWQSFQDVSPEPFIRDASFVKLREISIGYSLPTKWLRKTPFAGVTFSAYGRNLAILYSNVENIDPESTYNTGNGQGFEYGSLPSRRTFGFGINVKF